MPLAAHARWHGDELELRRGARPSRAAHRAAAARAALPARSTTSAPPRRSAGAAAQALRAAGAARLPRRRGTTRRRRRSAVSDGAARARARHAAGRAGRRAGSSGCARAASTPQALPLIEIEPRADAAALRVGAGPRLAALRPRRVRQPERGAALLRRAAGRRSPGRDGARGRRARRRHAPRRCATPACRRRRSSRRRPTRPQFDSEALWAAPAARATGAARACSSCAATAGATGWPSDCVEAGAQVDTRRAPTGAWRRASTGAARDRRRRRDGRAGDDASGCSAAREAVGHLEQRCRRPGRWPRPRARGHASAHRARARRLGFGRRRRGAAGARRGGRLHTIDATVNDDPSPAAAPRDRRLHARRLPRLHAARRAAASRRVARASIAVLLLALRRDRRARSSPGAPTSACAAASASSCSASRTAPSQVTEARAARAPGAGRRARRRRQGRAARGAPRRGRAAARPARGAGAVGGALARREPAWPTSRPRCASAVQQAALTGSAEPLVAALKQSDERLARANQPRLEPVRRAVARDLDRVKAAERRRRRDALDQARRGGAPGRRAAAAVGGRAAPRPRRATAPARGAAPAPAAAVGARRPGGWAVARARPARGALLRRQHLVGDPLAGARHAHRPARGDAGRARAGLLPAREPEAAPAQRAPGAAVAPVRRGRRPTCAGRRARRALLRSLGAKRTQIAAELVRQVAQQARGSRRAAARRHARRARRGRPPRERSDATGCRDARSRSGSSCCSPSRSWRRRPSAPTTAWRRFYWGGWRLDLSLNLFLLLLIGTCFLLVAVIQALNSLIGLPRRAREWRVARRDRSGQAALREALAQYFGGRYTPRAEVGAARARDPGRDARAGAGQRVHRARPPARRRQRASRCRTAPCATRSCARRSTLAAAQPRGALGRGGRAPARRRMGARRPRRAARAASCSPSCRSASRGARRRCA